MTHQSFEPLQVRQAILADLPQLNEVMLAANQHSIDITGFPQWMSTTNAITALKQHIESGECFVLGSTKIQAAVAIVDEDEVWGAEGYDGRALYMHKLMRDPNTSNPGYGRHLIRFIVEQANQRGKDLIRCDANDYLGQLLAYYERLGFKKMRETVYPSFDIVAVLLEADTVVLSANLNAIGK